MTLEQARLDELWDFSDAVASEARLRAAAAEGPDAEELLTQVARALGLQDRFAEADAVLDGIIAATDAGAVRTRISLERGRLRNSSGDADAAIPHLYTAVEIAADAELDFLRVDALHMLAIADPARSADWTDAAFAVLENVTDARTLRWRVSLWNNRGWSLADAGELDEALAAFEASRDAAVHWGTPQQVVWADEAIAETRERRTAQG
ncbi:hypothetical protein [Microbacterium candidum]|uniref:Tetratricopeptide repeat protein n=1 Tax=Microbacterium candidum TaxID=3041922 RepID=A0ABT7N3R2_9MICO|nr:hypothetical protein [Microbacterium sp. ASV49]MDL9981333.1 hypothetical protein [Microbacterium sp. ASV49]